MNKNVKRLENKNGTNEVDEYKTYYSKRKRMTGQKKN